MSKIRTGSGGGGEGGGGDAVGGVDWLLRCFFFLRLPLWFLASAPARPSRPSVPPSSAPSAPRRERVGISARAKASSLSAFIGWLLCVENDGQVATHEVWRALVILPMANIHHMRSMLAAAGLT